MRRVRLFPSFFFIVSLLCVSCSISGLTDGYSKLSDLDKKVIGYSSKADTISKKILMLNGKELLGRLNPNKLNVVYRYNPYCRNEVCVPLSVVRHSIPKEVDLYVVSRVLDHRVIVESDMYPIYGMDKYYYEGKYLFEYEDRFFDDLTGRDNSSLDTLNLYLFKGRDFVRTIPLDHKY